LAQTRPAKSLPVAALVLGVMAMMMDSAGDSSSLGGGAEAGTEAEPWIHQGMDQLIRRWKNEKYAPEILPFDQQNVEDLSEATEFVSEILHEEMADSEEKDPNDPDYRLRCIDHDRVKYVLRDYLRIRLWKITQWPQHYLEPDNIEVLSEAERTFLREYWDAKKGFLENRLLDALPPAKRALDEKIDLLDMVQRPNLDKHVYVRITGEIPKLTVSPSQTTQGSEPQPLVLANGQTYLIRYSVIREFLMDSAHDGKVELV